MKPKVSIITISKDDPTGLAATVASVLAQAFHDFELVIVRSGKSLECTLPPDPRLIVCDTPARGISHAFNEGVQRAGGEWIQFLNGGDSYADHGSLQLLVEQARPAIQFVGSFAKVEERNFTIPRRRLRPGRDSFIYVSHQATMFRAALFRQYGLFSTEIKIHMDLEWLTRLPRETAYAFVDNVTVRFDPYGVSATQVVRSSIEEAEILWRSQHYRGRVLWVLMLLLPFRMLRKTYRSMF